jgi:hypothetical protein
MLASVLTTIEGRRPCVHCHRAHDNQNAAGASEKTPLTEIRLTTSSGPEITASGKVHRLNAIRQTTKAATNQRLAITLDVTQSQVTPVVSLLAEQPHGLDAITNTDISTAASAHTPNTTAMMLVVRSGGLGGAEATNRAQSRCNYLTQRPKLATRSTAGAQQGGRAELGRLSESINELDVVLGTWGRGSRLPLHSILATLGSHFAGGGRPPRLKFRRASAPVAL